MTVIRIIKLKTFIYNKISHVSKCLHSNNVKQQRNKRYLDFCRRVMNRFGQSDSQDIDFIITIIIINNL